MHNERVIQSGDAARPEKRTDSGELERKDMKRRKIDCGADATDRRQLPRNGDRRNTGFTRPPSPES